jgi:DNA-binding NtrC family response regulator
MTGEAPPNATRPLARAGLPVRRLQVGRAGEQTPLFVAETDRLSIGSAMGNDLRLDDPTVSRFHVELGRRADRIVVTDLGSTNGVAIGPVSLRGASVEVAPGTVMNLGRVALWVGDADVVLLEHGPRVLGGLRGTSVAMRRVMSRIEQAAKSDVSVLVLGESGTGKELVGRALHQGSGRASAAFVTVDCAALSPTLFASELFGHERGAFTGAVRQHAGAFERAHGGTLFLDEIGELSPELQSALLGVLERRSLRRLGGTRDIQVDVRLISATSRDLLKEVNQARFRLDLFYRIAVVRVDMPPLRDRPEDVPLLIEHFLAEEDESGRLATLFDAATMARLKEHAWPGNIRELRNVVLGALALGHTPEPVGDSSGPADADASGNDELREGGRLLSYKEARRRVVDAFERRYLEALLAASGGNVRESARRAGMNRSYLIELLEKHRLP